MISKMVKNKKTDEWSNVNEEKVIFEWEAEERAFKKRDRDFWVTCVAILVLFSVILFFAKEFFLIVALGSALFLYYVLSTVPPARIKNKISNRGVYFGEKRYEWEILERFWFGQSLNCQMVFIETKLRFPGQIALVINPKDKKKIKELLTKKIPLVENQPSFVDKVTIWFSKRIPLEEKR